MTDDLGAKAPKYLQIAAQLRREVREGKFKPDNRLPAETALAERFRVSPITLRNAIGVLRAEGLIESRHGVGTFVRESRRLHRRSRDRYGRARKDQRLLTSHLRHEIVFAGRVPVPAHIAEVMDIEAGTEIVVRRRNLYDRETGKPEEIGASYIPADFAAGTYLEEPTVVPKGLFLCVEDLSGKRYTTARDQWVARLPTADEAAALALPMGAPVMHVIHTARAEDGSILEVSESVWPADRIMVIDDYQVEPTATEPEAPSEV
ncbi:GntR family transcriptional regulator [Micromonospora aurantiaca]|uniref:GntR family transcriptional regulator n=1 Tax=Micromonospora aurantiaca (nom. illeg.) TaxID=47850 RepID=A0ABQ6UFX8_9ACTN|nr:GntR family transcriptional regulator [Micromonospora aurantiaca]KAB1112428.1 GntR family transcriptional regulator [Micromonospora aurantiaca]